MVGKIQQHMPLAPALARCCGGLWGQREGRGREVPGLGFSAEREAVLSPGQCRSGPSTLGPAIGPKLGQPGR